MIISEKGLCRLLKREYKETGYKIIQEGDTTIISADGIVLTMASSAIPRQLLGLLVEHSGDIPANCSIQVAKGMDNQTMFPGAALNLDTHMENPTEAKCTPLNWDAYFAIYQCGDNRVFAVRGDHLEVLADSGRPVADLEKEVAAWYGDKESVFIPILTKKENAHLAALESHRWTL